MEEIYATVEGKKKKEARLAELISRRREIAEQIKTAREFGDLKENAEYAAAREAQNNLETEINEIEAMLPSIKVFSYAKADTSCVNIGTKVTVTEGRKTHEFVISGALKTDEEEDYVSNISPVGRALMGKKVGDTVEVKIPAKPKFTITKIGRIS